MVKNIFKNSLPPSWVYKPLGGNFKPTFFKDGPIDENIMNILNYIFIDTITCRKQNAYTLQIYVVSVNSWHQFLCSAWKSQFQGYLIIQLISVSW